MNFSNKWFERIPLVLILCLVDDEKVNDDKLDLLMVP